MSVGFRRIVTGHDADGNGTLVSDAPPTLVVQVGGPGGPLFHEVWATRDTPALIARGHEEPLNASLELAPPQGGTRLRVIEFSPESDEIRRLDPAAAREAFGSMGSAAASTSTRTAPHPLMHRTETVDYGIVLEGEITLILDCGQTTIGAGDIVIQRGTSHAWSNRSDRPCRVAFVLIDGRFSDGL